VTTGCVCPTCGSLTPQRGVPCRWCEIDAMPAGIGKAVSAAAHRLLYGAPIAAGMADTSAARGAEAGS
jgi:hypothetical protein